MFGSHDPDSIELSDEHIDASLAQIKRNARNRRAALIAPLALAAAVVVAFIAAPTEHGGLTLLPEADASDNVELPRVFGANGNWRVAEPIQDQVDTAAPGPAYTVDIPDEPDAPDFDLVAPDSLAGNESLSASASTPPTPTLRQSENDQPDPADIDWSIYQPEIRFEIAPAPVPVPVEAESSSPATTEPVISVDSVEASDDESTEAVEAPSDANPSRPQAEQPDQVTLPAVTGEVATITPRSVLVHSAHVSITVQVDDVDSDVIDWCNTRVDWGDGSVTGLAGPDGVAACAALCERGASSSGLGISEEVTFTHEYVSRITASPRLFVATGDGCSFELAELQLNPFTVVPW